MILSSAFPDNICQNKNFNARCGEGEVIQIDLARYGRMDSHSPCIDKNFGYEGCYDDVLAETQALCSGRRLCTVRIPNTVFDEKIRGSEAEGCPADLKSYFQAEYHCMKGKDNEFLIVNSSLFL